MLRKKKNSEKETGGASASSTSTAETGGEGNANTPDDADSGSSPELELLESEDAGSEESLTDDLAAQYLDQLQRLKAEFDNYRRRTSKEKEAWWRESKAALLAELLPVLDDVQRARQHADSGETPDTQGLLLICRNFAESLSKIGLEEMDTKVGTEFDPERHEALMAAPNAEISEGAIVDTVEPGYVYEGQILRPGKVIVSSGPTPE